jgi:hypothetical protein
VHRNGVPVKASADLMTEAERQGWFGPPPGGDPMAMGMDPAAMGGPLPPEGAAMAPQGGQAVPAGQPLPPMVPGQEVMAAAKRFAKQASLVPDPVRPPALQKTKKLQGQGEGPQKPGPRQFQKTPGVKTPQVGANNLRQRLHSLAKPYPTGMTPEVRKQATDKQANIFARSLQGLGRFLGSPTGGKGVSQAWRGGGVGGTALDLGIPAAVGIPTYFGAREQGMSPVNAGLLAVGTGALATPRGHYRAFQNAVGKARAGGQDVATEFLKQQATPLGVKLLTGGTGLGLHGIEQAAKAPENILKATEAVRGAAEDVRAGAKSVPSIAGDIQEMSSSMAQADPGAAIKGITDASAAIKGTQQDIRRMPQQIGGEIQRATQQALYGPEGKGGLVGEMRQQLKPFRDVAEQTSGAIGDLRAGAKKYAPYVAGGAAGLGGLYLLYKILQERQKAKDKQRRNEARRSGGGTTRLTLRRPGTYTINKAGSAFPVSRTNANYRPTPDKDDNCGTCRHYCNGECPVVGGAVAHDWTCDYYEDATKMAVDAASVYQALGMEPANDEEAQLAQQYITQGRQRLDSGYARAAQQFARQRDPVKQLRQQYAAEDLADVEGRLAAVSGGAPQMPSAPPRAPQMPSAPPTRFVSQQQPRPASGTRELDLARMVSNMQAKFDPQQMAQAKPFLDKYKHLQAPTALAKAGSFELHKQAGATDFAAGFLSHCRGSGMNDDQIRSSIEKLGATYDDETIQELTEGLEKTANIGALASKGLQWGGRMLGWGTKSKNLLGQARNVATPGLKGMGQKALGYARAGGPVASHGLQTAGGAAIGAMTGGEVGPGGDSTAGRWAGAGWGALAGNPLTRRLMMQSGAGRRVLGAGAGAAGGSALGYAGDTAAQMAGFEDPQLRSHLGRLGLGAGAMGPGLGQAMWRGSVKPTMAVAAGAPLAEMTGVPQQFRDARQMMTMFQGAAQGDPEAQAQARQLVAGSLGMDPRAADTVVGAVNTATAAMHGDPQASQQMHGIVESMVGNVAASPTGQKLMGQFKQQVMQDPEVQGLLQQGQEAVAMFEKYKPMIEGLEPVMNFAQGLTTNVIDPMLGMIPGLDPGGINPLMKFALFAGGLMTLGGGLMGSGGMGGLGVLMMLGSFLPMLMGGGQQTQQQPQTNPNTGMPVGYGTVLASQ